MDHQISPNGDYGASVCGGINYSYTDSPWRIFAWDAFHFFRLAWALPWLLMPFRPYDSGSLSELAPTHENLRCVFIHTILVVMQTLFILSFPFAIFFPIWTVVAGVVAFLFVNRQFCTLLNNGRPTIYTSDRKYAVPSPEHAHEE